MRVLIVEDERRIAADIRTAVQRSGWVADLATDGETAWFQAETQDYDAVVLDLGLPRLDGLSVLKRLRTAGVATPVLILTARDGWREKVEGIDAGADDYLTKPFQMEELLARLRAITRRAAGVAGAVLKAGPIELDTRSRTVAVDGRTIGLSALEYRLLSQLMMNRGRVLSQTELIEHLYASDDERETNALEALVTRVRRKIGSSVIETRRGHGYCIAADQK